ncbi:hypothetical protein OAD26_00020 [bacterium]|nr:hypothetical protein [bacterium]
MYLHTHTPEIEEELRTQFTKLPPELSKLVVNDAYFTTLSNTLSQHIQDKEVVETIKYEVFLILMRITTLEELLATLMVECDLDIDQAVKVSAEIEHSLPPAIKQILLAKEGAKSTAPAPITKKELLQNFQTKPVVEKETKVKAEVVEQEKPTVSGFQKPMTS